METRGAIFAISLKGLKSHSCCILCYVGRVCGMLGATTHTVLFRNFIPGHIIIDSISKPL